eukprot:2898866-Heterocapsa_arctica.AAC.1
MIDIQSDMTAEERATLAEGQPWKVEATRLLYADDTLILSSTAGAAELMLWKIRSDSAKYNLNLDQNKCVLIRMNSVHNVRYADGHNMPVLESAVYLGSNINSSGNQHAEIKT